MKDDCKHRRWTIPGDATWLRGYCLDCKQEVNWGQLFTSLTERVTRLEDELQIYKPHLYDSLFSDEDR